MQVQQGRSADYDRKNENEHFSVWTRTFVAKVLPLRLSHLVFSEGAHADSNWWNHEFTHFSGTKRHQIVKRQGIDAIF